MKWFLNRKNKAVTQDHKEAGFFVPKDTVIHGGMETPVPCRIEGVVEGDVSVKGTLIITEAAEIRGDVSCDDLTVYGKVGGHISCTHKAVIAAGAYVDGTITAAEVEIEEQATVMNRPFEEPEPVFFETPVRTVISPSRAVVNENTWF